MRQIYGSVDRWAEVYGIPIKSWDDIEELDDPLRGYINKRKHLADREAFMQRICKTLVSGSSRTQFDDYDSQSLDSW